MNQANKDKLLKDFPCIKTSNIDCGDGWEPIIRESITEALAFDDTLIISTVKEKFGELRIYFGADIDADSWDQVYDIFEDALQESLKTCEYCGTKENVLLGKALPTSDWIKTLCNRCRRV